MPDNTTAEVASSGDLRLVADFERDNIIIGNYPQKSEGADVLRRRAARLEATADALDSLREAVKGCGGRDGIGVNCGSFHWWSREMPSLCNGCKIKRDSAISQLLGSGSETTK